MNQITESPRDRVKTTLVTIPKQFSHEFIEHIGKKQLMLQDYLQNNSISEEKYFLWKRYQEENLSMVKVPHDILVKRKKIFIFFGSSEIFEDIEKTFLSSFKKESLLKHNMSIHSSFFDDAAENRKNGDLTTDRIIIIIISPHRQAKRD
jgi:hypothetical protein